MAACLFFTANYIVRFHEFLMIKNNILKSKSVSSIAEQTKLSR